MPHVRKKKKATKKTAKKHVVKAAKEPAPRPLSAVDAIAEAEAAIDRVVKHGDKQAVVKALCGMHELMWIYG